MKKLFGPEPWIRNFKCSDYIGKTVTLTLEHINQRNQYVSFYLISKKLRLSGWSDRLHGKPGEKIKRKIKGLYLIEHANGGRGDYGKYDSYSSFFNSNRKKIIESSFSGGMMFRLTHCGDPDRADIVVEFDDFKLDSFAFEFEYPREWYSEYYKSNPSFRFIDGFYSDATTAIERFSKKSHDDLFGERYFPVIVFPVSKIEIARDIAGGAKAASDAIVSNKQAIIGLRCKPHEYPNIIERTYQSGGKVPIGVEYNWS